MRFRAFISLAVILVGFLALGARGCEVWAETDALTYSGGAQSVATLHNDTADTAFLPGCGGFNLERLDGSKWIDMGPFMICVWEGMAQPVEAGAVHEVSFTAPEAVGAYRVHFPVSFGCAAGKPLSQADCSGSQDVYTPQFEVTATAPATCADWNALYLTEAANVAACTSPDECVALPGTSCGCTRNLVVNETADLETFWQIHGDMADSGCALMTTCDCPAADGFLCQDGQCAWNYL